MRLRRTGRLRLLAHRRGSSGAPRWPTGPRGERRRCKRLLGCRLAILSDGGSEAKQGRALPSVEPHLSPRLGSGAEEGRGRVCCSTRLSAAPQQSARRCLRRRLRGCGSLAAASRRGALYATSARRRARRRTCERASCAAARASARRAARWRSGGGCAPPRGPRRHLPPPARTPLPPAHGAASPRTSASRGASARLALRQTRQPHAWLGR
mmetsp:Transcript_40580/g.131348  ORF Transcript_40580/g.131348 Transcript_40580/m.131348 type:complete len:210 (+) Transcript_40580:1740-2369(+)